LSPEPFIFPNKKGGFMDSSNYRNRVLHGLARELELPKLTFQVIRRTIATLAQKKGTAKDIQGVLRHSRTATTTDVYMQQIPESVQKTVDAISAELRLLPNLEEVTGGTRGSLPNATKLKSGVSASS
jgi:integrase